MNISALWDTLVDAICRPPRDKYQIGELVGGRRGYCRLSGQTIVREDVTLVNKRGQKLQCSHYKPAGATAEHALPVVVYCHCNSGSRRDAEEAFYVLLPHNITVFCLDFAGSGLSDGDWVTLGAMEVDDLEVAVAHLREALPNSTIGLWGRSMGAVTALLYSAKDPSIAGVVMDSPFARLTELMVELVEEQKLPIPRAFMKVALSMMRRSVRKRAGFDIDAVAPLDIVPHCFIPALFGHATEDTFVSKSHSQRLHDAYCGGDKSLVTFKGDHNSVRPQSFYSAVLLFLHTALRCPDNLGSLPMKPEPLSTAPSSMAAAEPAEVEAAGLRSRQSSCIKEPEASPRRREMAPPWDREQARSNTEQQLAKIRTAPEAAAAGPDIARDYCDPSWLEPPSPSQRAPWLDAGTVAVPSRAEKRRSENGRQASSDSGRGQPAGSSSPERQPQEAACVAHPITPATAVSGMSEEDRFWHLQPGTDLLSTEEEEALLTQALEMSMREASCQSSAPSTATSLGPAGGRLEELVPDRMRNISQEDAEEMMLAEAIKMSLLDAQQNGLLEAQTEPPGTRRSAAAGQSPDQSASSNALAVLVYTCPFMTKMLLGDMPTGASDWKFPVNPELCSSSEKLILIEDCILGLSRVGRGGSGERLTSRASAGGKNGRKSRNLFWRRKEPDPPPSASKGVTQTF